MRAGMILPVKGIGDEPLGPKSLVTGAKNIEDAGFDSVWCFDAMGRGFIIPDPLIGVSVAAVATEHIEVGTCILQVPLRRTAELAHRALTAHLVSDGRLTLGVGAGSTRADYDLVGADFEARFRNLGRALEDMRNLWAGGEIDGLGLTPWPSVLGGPPVLIGSWGGSVWVPRAAKEFDGWIASAAKTSWKVLEDGMRRFREAGGNRAIVTNLVADLHGDSAPPLEEQREESVSLLCDAKEAEERLARLQEIGFDDVIMVSMEQRPEVLEELRSLI